MASATIWICQHREKKKWLTQSIDIKSTHIKISIVYVPPFCGHVPKVLCNFRIHEPPNKFVSPPMSLDNRATIRWPSRIVHTKCIRISWMVCDTVPNWLVGAKYGFGSPKCYRHFRWIFPIDPRRSEYRWPICRVVLRLAWFQWERHRWRLRERSSYLNILSGLPCECLLTILSLSLDSILSNHFRCKCMYLPDCCSNNLRWMETE